MTIEWWHWLVVGLILVALELAASGGFYVIFFGIAALAIGALRLFDLAGPGLDADSCSFRSSRSVALMFFRQPLLRWLQLDAAAA